MTKPRGGVPVHKACIPDTGAEQTVIPASFAKAANFEIDVNNNSSMSAANGSAIRILGTCRFPANFPETQKSASGFALVACDTRDILISWHDLISLGWDMRFLAGKVRALTEQSSKVYKQFEMKLIVLFWSISTRSK